MGNTINAYEKVDLWGGGTIYIYIRIRVIVIYKSAVFLGGNPL